VIIAGLIGRDFRIGLVLLVKFIVSRALREESKMSDALNTTTTFAALHWMIFDRRLALHGDRRVGWLNGWEPGRYIVFADSPSSLS